MYNVDNMTIEGFVTHDPMMKKTKTGKNVCNFSIAVQHGESDGGEHNVSFFDVETWEKTAADCAERIKKGRRVLVFGSLRQDRWQDPEGAPRSKVKIIGSHIMYITNKKDLPEAEASAGQ